MLQEEGGIAFEQIAGEESSPLNAPVIEKDIAGNRPGSTNESSSQEGPSDEGEPSTAFGPNEPVDDGPLDAPEQQIWEDLEDPPVVEEESLDETFELPTAHAKQAADTFLGMADNFMEIGGGFFVKVKKQPIFYDFDEIVQVIDEHNAQNVQKLRFTKADKALLRPLLVAVLKKKAQRLTPEQQLMGALLSILVRKAQMVMEVRAENEILVERITQIIREERAITPQEHHTDEPEADEAITDPEEERVTAPEPARQPPPPVMAPESVLEVAEEEPNEG